MPKQEEITIIGAGLCGSLLALRLAQRGYQVTVYESRPDLRTTDISAGKSINLALSDRGFKALRLVGMEEKAREICIPMYGRLIHDVQGNTFASDYSGRKGEYINSISRSDLNGLLLTEAEKHAHVNIHFNHRCTAVSLDTHTASFTNTETGAVFSKTNTVIFGTDGAGSILRKSYEAAPDFTFTCTQDFLTHGYKELEIPAATDGTHLLSKDHLHIWPRGDYMLIALPNLDGSFTVTLFLGHEEGVYNFKNLETTAQIISFFETQFPDALAVIPNIASEFANNPTGALGTVKCAPWYSKNKTLILGDAAHAVVPFYGQGMNASFEDVTVLDTSISLYEDNWEEVFKHYEAVRKSAADAIGDLAVENYYEMRDHVADPLFQQKRKIEMLLEKNFPTQYFSKYSMVTFNENISYDEAMLKGNAQDKAILKLLSEGEIAVTEDVSVAALSNILITIQKATEQLLA